MASSQPITTKPPMRGFTKTRTRATISITPTMCMNVAADTGTMLSASGFKYTSHCVSRFGNLSAPAIIGTAAKRYRKLARVVRTTWLSAAGLSAVVACRGYVVDMACNDLIFLLTHSMVCESFGYGDRPDVSPFERCEDQLEHRVIEWECDLTMLASR